MAPHLTRRLFLGSAGALGATALPAIGQPAPAAPPAYVPAGPVPSGKPRAFFTAPEERFVTAAVDRLIPPDPEWPGAVGAGVVDYLDQQLAGAYGEGHRMFLAGPWKPDAPPEFGYQLPYAPAQLYKAALADILELVPKREKAAFWDLPPDRQDKVLKALESGEMKLPSVPAPVFFETLLANTVEGFLSDPVHGGNRDMVGWRMLGFPGAYASFIEHVDNHGMAYDRPPMSIAQAASGGHHHGHDHGAGHGFPGPAARR